MPRSAMFKSLWQKFFVLLLAVVLIALAAAFTLRQLMIRDFRDYENGQLEDRVYWVIADLESSYQKNSAWGRQAADRDAIWALMMGFKVRLFDSRHVLLADSDKSLTALAPLIQKRVVAISRLDMRAGPSGYYSYPLFLNGRQIGTLEAGFLGPERESVFVRRSDQFLLFTVIGLGGIAFILSILFSRRLTNPLKRLAASAEGITRGDFSRQSVSGRDEVARLAAAFNRAAKFLEAQEQLRKKLLSNVTHEIRTPLAAMRGELAGMMDGLIPNDKEQLQSLYDETVRLEGFLEGMEDLSRAQAGAVFPQKKEARLSLLLENIKKTFAGIILDRQATLEISCPDDLNAYADPEKLSQIIINLVSNALKAVHKGGKVAVTAGKCGGGVCIEVLDNGCGIGKDALPFIFERFYKSSEGGIGIGLAIVKELVDAHEGRIEVRSEEGKGTAFKLFLPDRNMAER